MAGHGEVITAGAVVTPDGLRGPTAIRVVDGRIAEVHDTTGPVPDTVLAPGFVDLQVNGVDDVDCSAATGADWARAGALLAACGVTAWLPTLISQPLDRYGQQLDAIADAMAPGSGPQIVGAHLEGPFLGGRPGAHRPEHVVPLDRAWLADLPAHVRLVTLAPEQAGSTEAIGELVARGVTVSIGHSAADADEVEAAAAAGASLVTHLFNGMPPMHHREPGLVGAALTDDRLAVSMIADGIHVDPRLYRLVFRSKGASSVVLVSDAVGWRTRRLATLDIHIVDGAPRLPDGTLAGSALTMDRAVRNVVASGVPLEQALTAASTTPCRVIGLADRGRIAPGQRADLVVLGGDDLEVRRTVVEGTTVWER